MPTHAVSSHRGRADFPHSGRAPPHTRPVRSKCCARAASAFSRLQVIFGRKSPYSWVKFRYAVLTARSTGDRLTREASVERRPRQAVDERLHRTLPQIAPEVTPW